MREDWVGGSGGGRGMHRIAHTHTPIKTTRIVADSKKTEMKLLLPITEY